MDKTVNRRYLEQYERVKRWQNLLDEIILGRKHDKDSDYYQDVILAFFQNCYHLKDWVIASNILEEKTVQKLFGASARIEMKVCRDLCNGSKHLKLTRAALDKNTKIRNRNFSLIIGIGHPIISVDYIIEADGKEFFASILAKDCMRIWAEFFHEHQLNPHIRLEDIKK